MKQDFSDIELIAKVCNGQQHLYALLVDKYKNYVFTLCYRILQNRENAEEAAQDTFIKTYRQLHSYKGDAKFSTWLYTIARNTCFTFLRKKKLPAYSLDEYGGNLLPGEPADNSINTHYNQAFRQQLINNAYKQLPAEDVTILTLFYNHEQKIDEIAQVMQLEANNVKIKLFRARQKLKTILEKKFAGEIKNIV